jgi:hypothetical protein
VTAFWPKWRPRNATKIYSKYFIIKSAPDFAFSPNSFPCRPSIIKRAFRMKRILLLILLVSGFSVLIPSKAQADADDYYYWRWRRHEWHERQHQIHEWRREHWREYWRREHHPYSDRYYYD